MGVTDASNGPGTPNDNTLKLCGDVSGGKRTLELGISDTYDSIGFATTGAKAIAVEADAGRIAEMRALANTADVHVECHDATDLADLGFLTSGSIEVVLANHTLDRVDDPGRLFRQVHRVLKPNGSLVISVDHPAASLQQGDSRYGAGALTIGDWFTQLGRAGFRIDALQELGVDATSPAPTTLVLRARKEGL